MLAAFFRFQHYVKGLALGVLSSVSMQGRKEAGWTNYETHVLSMLAL